MNEKRVTTGRAKGARKTRRGTLTLAARLTIHTGRSTVDVRIYDETSKLVENDRAAAAAARRAERLSK
jgi:hypothetical protein